MRPKLCTRQMKRQKTTQTPRNSSRVANMIVKEKLVMTKSMNRGTSNAC